MQKREGDTCQQWEEQLVVHPPRLVTSCKSYHLGLYEDIMRPAWIAIENVCVLWGPGPENPNVKRMSEAERIAAYAAIGGIAIKCK